MKALVRNPIAWGIFLTVLVLTFVSILACVEDKAGVAAYSRFLELDPNAMGDTLAGIFASLAFIWIVVTVFLQSAELREQREVMVAQRTEFEQMARSQAAQVVALEAQAKIFEDESSERKQAAAKQLLDQLLEQLSNEIYAEATMGNLFGREFGNEIALRVFSGDRKNSVDAYIRENSRAFRNFYVANENMFDAAPDIKFGGAISPFLRMQEIMDEIESIKEGLGADQVVRLRKIGFDRLRTDLKSFVDEDHWDEEAYMSREYDDE